MIRTALVFCAAAALTAQEKRPEYEAASIKPNISGSTSSSTNGTKGQIVFTNQSLKRLIERAYTVKPFQVIAPAWAEGVNFDIIAKYPADSQREDNPLMLRTLLEDRFKLAIHRESKDMPGYALVVAKGGAKLQASAEQGDNGSSTNTNSDGRLTKLTAKHTSMAVLADLIGRSLGEMVVDKTGLQGNYDFELRWARENPNPAPDAEPLPSIFTAVTESLGLRLQAQKVPVEIIVVDRLERVPTEN